MADIILDQTDSAKALNRANLLATFPLDGSVPVMQKISDILEDGSVVNNELRWDPISNTWKAISSTQAIYAAVTRGQTFADISAIILSLFAQGGDTYYDATLDAFGSNSFGGYDSTTGGLNNIWPAAGPAPTVWAITPRYYDWLKGTSFIARVRHADDVPGTFTRAAFDILISGVRYEVGFKLLPLTDITHFSIAWDYVAPPASAVTVVEATVPVSP